MKKGLNVFLLLVAISAIIGIGVIFGSIFWLFLFVMQCFAM